MKRVLLQILLALCFVPSLAQGSYQEDSDSIDIPRMVKWDERKLRWDDFKALNPTNGKTSYHLSLYAKVKSLKKKIDGVVYKYYAWDSFMEQGRSWIDANSMTETKLKHCQNQFDLWELMLRKSAFEYPQIDAGTYHVYTGDWRMRYDKEVEWMNLVTDNGNDTHAVDSIANDLANELAKMELNPKEMMEGFVPMPVQIMYDVAVLTHVPFSDYLSMSYGFSLGFGVAYKNILIGGDIDVAFGKWKKHVDDPQGVIGKDALLTTGGVTGYLGYNVYDSKKLSLTPFIGLGIRSVTGGEKYEEYREKNKTNKVDYSSFSFGAGVMFDFKFWHSINANNDFVGIENHEKSIRVKPYLSFTRYGNGIGWVPALNVCVGMKFKTLWLKKKNN